ncbi:MAC/perforin domain-containing protein [Pararcticibacter amylolyticus]|uniref:MACPF domain-containing protein n=1 Tax=Pararcticibacter amylolyticus TaxID=2173175 RepID=A0A2U2PIF6_9SPHI|nr:MAC/perforin domain-containing protein [Pararcticibacter amylolyticus]PWG81188.1 hypothetical protein DDR33_07315 [Pararcticibacter amylolyticus]
MKKTLIIFLVLGLGACRKQELSLKEQTNDRTKQKNASISSAGDNRFDALGYGYDVTGEYAHSLYTKAQVVNILALMADHPTRVDSDKTHYTDGKFTVGSNAYDLTKGLTANVTTTFGGIGGKGFLGFKQTIKAAFKDTSSYSEKYVYAHYSRMLARKRVFFTTPTMDILKNYLSESFKEDLKTVSAAELVKRYGTHVLTNIVLGAKLDILYQTETTKSDRFKAGSIGLDVNIWSAFHIEGSAHYTQSENSENYNQTINYTSRGGENNLKVEGNIFLAKGTDVPPTINYSDWEASCSDRNMTLINFGPNGMLPLWDFIEDPAKKAEVQNYISGYLEANQVHLIYRTRTIKSSAFYNVYMRLDGSSFSPFVSGSGKVNCQYGAGPFESVKIAKLEDGTYSIESGAYPGLFLRMDGTGVTGPLGNGGGVVNLQDSAGGYERFNINRESDGNYSIRSATFPGVLLRMDAYGVTKPLSSGGGKVNCQGGGGAGDYEKFIIEPALTF